MNVAALQTTPVKGAMLHHPDAIDIGPNGVETNRRFYLIDGRGRMFNGKRNGRLARLEADYDPDPGRLTIRFPDGETVSGAVATAGERIETSFYGRPVLGHAVGGPFSEALSDHIGRAVRLLASDVPGDAIDVHPVTIVSSASIAEVASHVRVATVDRRRFRMLVEVDGCDAHAEDEWIGREVALGSAVVRPVGPVPRCVVTTHDPDTGRRNVDMLRTILRYRGARAGDDLDTPVDHLPDGGKVVFGVYATVIVPGRVTVGDAVSVSEAGVARAAA
jgi:uncharacterized protein YcbX